MQLIVSIIYITTESVYYDLVRVTLQFHPFPLNCWFLFGTGNRSRYLEDKDREKEKNLRIYGILKEMKL
jgi:hypothetical protein